MTRIATATVLVIVPTFNEAPNVAELVNRVAGAVDRLGSVELIFVDDSTDDTPDVIRRVALDADIPVRLIHRDVPEGRLGGAVVAGLSLIYRYGPNRATARKRWVTPGAVTATVLWMVASLAFSVYVASFADYNKTYGSLGAIVILLLWFYLGAFAILLGAEVNAEMELHTRRDTTTGPERPIGSRGAYVADNVAWDRRRPAPAVSSGGTQEAPSATGDRRV